MTQSLVLRRDQIKLCTGSQCSRRFAAALGILRESRANLKLSARSQVSVCEYSVLRPLPWRGSAGRSTSRAYSGKLIRSPETPGGRIHASTLSARLSKVREAKNRTSLLG